VISAKLNMKQWLISLMSKYLSGKSMGYKEIVTIIIPIFVDQAFLILMSMLNTAMISSSGVAAVSAVSMVDSLNIFLVNVFIAVATGGTVIVAQYKGTRNMEMVSKTAAQAVSAVTILSVSLGALVIVFHSPMIHLLFGNAETDVLNNAKIYIIGSAVSYPLIGIYQAVCGGLRGTGDTKPVLGLSLFMNLTNVLLNLLFITFLHMGIMGLVISVIVSRTLGMIASVIYLVKFNETIRLRIKEALHIDFSIQKKIMYIGMPFAAEQLFFNGGKLLTQTFIVLLGTYSLTSYAIANSIAWLYQIGPNALCIAIVTVVGQCMGRRDIEDARKFIKSFLGLSAIFFVISAIIFLPLFPVMMKMFNPPDEIIFTIFIMVLLSAVFHPILWSASFLLPAALRAAGDSKFTSITSLFTMWIVRVVLGYIFGITLGYEIIGVWVAMILEWGVRGIVFSLRFKGDKWYAHQLI
jgi:putative MATE family efflux protein